MDKNIKKIISEAFNEVYSEMMSEAPEAALRNLSISDEEVHGENGLLAKAMRSGRGFSYDQTSGDRKAGKGESEANFNNMIDALISDYEATGNEMSKRAIQNAFAPDPYKRNKIYTQIAKDYRSFDDADDAIMDAYKRILLDRFDETLAGYKNDGTFGGLVIKAMSNRVKDYLFKTNRTKGMTGVSGDEKQSFSGPESFEKKYGDEGRSLGDTVSGTALDTGFQGDEDAPIKSKIKNAIIDWLDNHVGSKEFPGVTPKRVLAVKLLLSGIPASQITKDYPEVFKNGKGNNSPTTMFYQVANSSAGQEISQLVSHMYGKYIGDWNMSDINPNTLEMTSSMSPEWGGHSRDIEKSTPKMRKAQSKLFNSLKSIGLTTGDFDSDKKINKIIEKLRDGEQEEKADEIELFFNELLDARQEARERGEFQQTVSVLPKSEKEELSSDEFGGMFEGIAEKDVDKLMERVLRRLSK